MDSRKLWRNILVSELQSIPTKYFAKFLKIDTVVVVFISHNYDNVVNIEKFCAHDEGTYVIVICIKL